ncbi:MAG TPA: response regulator, partial [Gemmatimonadales bacterium]
SVEEALKTVGRSPVDLIIADDVMQRLNGIDLLKLLEKEGHRIPVIIMTGYSSIENAVISIKSGAIDYLVKPIRAETLEIAVSQALEVIRLRRENESFRTEIRKLRATPSHFIDHLRFGAAEPPAAGTGAGTATGARPASGGAAIEMPVPMPAPDAPVFNLDEIERRAIDRALVATRGNRTRAAKLLGISERTLRNRLNTPKVATPGT